ncbi:enoyl-CoA hydratase/carnithine racemase [Luteibacter sp. Sphag1AF]|uniref:enoyl-CoA hydratase/isomerase family protein n=1 Tax=Luteibacter sp. Sphag1AF TaxID=2587031 RepID=UPI0016187FBB|nr:enoyl-CoA hydratase/isomerase family protein [Luteibacter sp. Sphag1AF]MBB3228898.1 enoyl-CoA hydratase/carnithine racemase [Luteibacter sp. Sphag1AF]
MTHETDAGAQAPVLFEEREAAGGFRIGIATLNAPATLNGLSLDMARLLDDQLIAWEADERIAVVVLQGSGEKAFCAGGDLQGLYRSMLAHRESGSDDILANGYARDFFEVEYRLDHRIHTCAKPVLCWGHGIVMGGGIGLMSGATHRVVTERSKLAMPEITVGLYPDVGGSWLLNRVPDHAGLFLALTGAPLGAADAIHAGLADHYLRDEQRADVYSALSAQAWSIRAADNAQALTSLLSDMAGQPDVGPLARHRDAIHAACAADTLDAVIAAIEAMPGDDPWLESARRTLAAGAPGSARLAFELSRRARDASLADVFRMEYVVSLHCAAHGDFQEGIRALLIDKDRQPRWNPATLADATPSWAEAFFAEPWSAGHHPLADLGRSAT